MPDGSGVRVVVRDARAPTDLTRTKAYSVFVIKSVDEQKRIIEGLATTPSPDSMQDVVEPKGAEFTLPLPLLNQHDSSEPIGQVIDAKVTANGIKVRCQIAADNAVLPEIARAWEQIKAGLVRGFSIGFSPIEYSFLESGGVHFQRWSWRELSVVTIPANIEATIQTIKSHNAPRAHALSGTAAQRGGVVRLSPSPAVAGSHAVHSRKGNEMNLNELLSGLEAKRAANIEAQQKTAKEGRTMTNEERQEYDRLDEEIDQVDEDLKRFRKQMQRAQTATPVPGNAGANADVALATRGAGPSVAVNREPNGNGVQTILARSMVPKELVYVRHVRAATLAAMSQGRLTPLDVAKSMYPDMPQLQNVFGYERQLGMSIEKANVTGMNVADAAGGGALAQYQLYSGDFVEWLRPQTIIGKFGQNGIPDVRHVPFMVSIAGQTSGGSGYWVGEGAPKPLTSIGFQRTTLGMMKVANIAVVTEEQLRASTPSADMLLRDALSGAIVERIDRDFIDPDAAGTANVQPASITYGATGTAVTGTNNAAVITDLQTLYAPVLANNVDVASLVLIMSAKTALALSMAQDSLGRYVFPDISMKGGTLKGIPVIVSQYADFGGGNSPASNGLIVLVAASEVWLADDGQVSIAMSNQASLQMLDNPTNNSVTPTPTTMVSMFQTDSVALRAERFINWARRRAGVVTYLTNVAYTGLA
jgi:HK97 family phage major capsid protein/HK97 family phage prohead protease